MDHDRYLAYRSTGRALGRMDLDAHEHERLRDTAEALLLTADREDAEVLRRDAATALSLLVGQRRCTDAAADVLWEQISECGPDDVFGTRHRVRALGFAGSL